MDPQHRLIDLKIPNRSTHHVPEDLDRKSPHDTVGHPQHKDEAEMGAAGDGHAHGEHHQHHDHHAHMVADFRRRFWVSLVLTLHILIFSPLLQEFLGRREPVGLPGALYALFAFSSAVFFYGGWPFLTGLVDELKFRKPGMMTLIAIALATAYFYSSAVVFGLKGKTFFWELATLTDIMLLGHWIEMKSVMGASRALEELARLMPSDAHKIMQDGSVSDVPLSELVVGDRVLVKPGEKLPADGAVVEGDTSVNEAMLTGESQPVAKRRGARSSGDLSMAKALSPSKSRVQVKTRSFHR
jgi:P-type Cu2+ transporter